MPRRIAATTALTAAAGAVLVLALLLQRLSGADGYPTDPIGTVALAAAAVLAQVARTRLTAAGNARAARLAGGLVAALLVLLVLSVAAVGLTSAAPSVLASAAVALWSVAWIPPLALAQLVASAAVRPHGENPRIHTVVLVTSAVAMLAGLLLWQPIDPFAGVAQIAPEAWPQRFAPVGEIATTLGFAGLLLLPVTLARAAAGSRDRARMRLGVAAAGTAAAPLIIVFCLALAIARDPGEVDPAAGSVAFQVGVAAGAAGGAVCGYLAVGRLVPGRVSLVARVAVLAVAALVVAAVGTLVVAAEWAPTLTALLVATVAVAATALAWRAGGLLGLSLARDEWSAALPAPLASAALPAQTPGTTATPSASRPAPDLDPDPLTSREREVLAHLADGASNAGIATQLVVSERTVDAHLRAIFTKLELAPDPGANRRVLAARHWLESRADAE